jgi:undecaprenyl-diphosphatase
MPSPNNELTLGEALALGALQGPTELLPISSSAHTSAAAWLFGWPYGEQDAEVRKSFEVALHTAGTLALLIVLRAEIGQALWGLDRRSLLVLASSSAPPAIAGYALRRQIESHLGTPATIAAALLTGAAAMALADGAPQERSSSDAGLRDGVLLGLAQAVALVPGLSRSGATLAVARMLRFRAADAIRLSDLIALPVLGGAALLKLPGLRSGVDRRTAGTFAAGACGAFASTLICGAFLARRRSSARLLPFAAYRAALASWMLIRRN